MGLGTSQYDPLAGLLGEPLPQEHPIVPPTSSSVLAPLDPLYSGPTATDPLVLAETPGTGLINWDAIDAAMAGMAGPGANPNNGGTPALTLSDYSSLVDLDQLTGLLVTDDPAELPSSLVQGNLPPLLSDAFIADQLLVHHGDGSIDLLAGVEALRLGEGNDAVVLRHGQPDNLWIDTGAGFDTATVHASQPPLLNQWRGVEQLRWQAQDDQGTPLAVPSLLGADHAYTLQEDQPFSLVLGDLFPRPDQLSSVRISALAPSGDGPTDWLQFVQGQPDDSIVDRLIIETLLRDGSGNLLSNAEIANLQPGSLIQADLVVSDTRAAGHGLIGLQLDLQWDPTALSLQDTVISPNLPLFRSNGSLDAAAGRLTGLAGASLPSAGSGSVLGDSHRDLFASLSFRIGSGAIDGLDLQLTPTKLPTSRNLRLDPDQVLAIGSEAAPLPVLQGLASQAQVGEQRMLLDGIYRDGRHWQQQLSLTIANVNDAPVALPAPPLTALEEQPLRIDLSTLFRDEDVALGDQLSYHMLGVSPSWLTLDATTGLISGLPDDAQVGRWSLNVEARDRSGASARQTLELTISNVNDVPRWSGEELPAIVVREGRPFRITLPPSLFQDADTGDRLRYSLDLEGHPDLASWLSIDPLSGVISGTAPEASSRPIQLQLRATDLAGASSSLDLSLEVHDQAANQAPTWVGEALKDRTIREGESLAYNLNDLFRDPDRLIGDQLHYTVVAPSWLRFDPNTGQVSGVADNAAVGSYSIEFRATDLDGAEAVMRFRLDVENVNQAPERLAPAQDTRQLQSGSSLQLDLDSIFRDLDAIHGDALTYSLELRSSSSLGQPDWLQWDAANGQLSLTPGADDRGLLSLRFTATDRSGLSNTYQLNLGIVGAGDLVEVNRILGDLTLQPGQDKRLDISEAFRQLRGSGEINYSLELLRRDSDGHLTPLGDGSDGWVTLLDRREQVIQRSNRVTIEPVLRLLSSGELISSDDLKDLRAGTGIQLSIAVEDLRNTSALPGLIGMDLGLSWTGLTLDRSNPADLRQAINGLMPLYRKVDLTALAGQQLRFSAASLPAMGLGQALGDTPGESFLTLNFTLSDPSQPVKIDLSLYGERLGGLGMGLADGSNGDALLNLLDWSSTPQLDLQISPGQKELGHYVVRLIADAEGGDSVSQVFALHVSDGSNQAPRAISASDRLTLEDNNTQTVPLSQLFSDPDGDPLTYRLRVQAETPEQEDILRGCIRLQQDSPPATLSFTIPGLTAPIQGALTIVGSDGSLESSQTIQVLLQPRSQQVPLFAREGDLASNSGERVGLGDLFAAPAVALGDRQDRTELELKADGPLQLRLSRAFQQRAGLSAEQVTALERSWGIADATSPNSRLRVSLNALAERLGTSGERFDLNWLELISPSAAGRTLTIDLASRTRVAGDEDGERFGSSESPWTRALLITRAAEAQQPMNSAATERFLSQLLRGRKDVEAELSQVAETASSQRSSTLLAWRSKQDFAAALEGTLEDVKPVVALNLRTSTDAKGGGAEAESFYQLDDVVVLGQDDDRFRGHRIEDGLQEGTQLETPWDPISFCIKAPIGAEGLKDVDPRRDGTQVELEMDLSQSGLRPDDFNAYRKFVAAETLAAAQAQGLVLRDLDGNPITTAGWYDFTQRRDADGNPVGDGARFVVQTINGEQRLTGIVLTFTDNAYGDNNLSLGVIDDPGMPVKVIQVAPPPPLPPADPGEQTPPTAAPAQPGTQAADGSLSTEAAGTARSASASTQRGGTGGGIADSPGAGAGGGRRPSGSGSGTTQENPESAAEAAGATGSPASPGHPRAAKGGNPQDPGDSQAAHQAQGSGKTDNTPQDTAPPGTDASIPGGRATPQAGAGDRHSNPLSEALTQLHNNLAEVVSPESALVGLMLGMVVVPNGVERSLRSLLFDSGLGEAIQLQRRNPELQAEWPLRLRQPDGSLVNLKLRLHQGRLQLLHDPNPEPSPGTDPADAMGLSSGALWQSITASTRPGAVMEQIRQRLENLLNSQQEEEDQPWDQWLMRIGQGLAPSTDQNERRGLVGLRQTLGMAQAVDLGFADALMAMELLDCHTRLGGQISQLLAPVPQIA